MEPLRIHCWALGHVCRQFENMCVLSSHSLTPLQPHIQGSECSSCKDPPSSLGCARCFLSTAHLGLAIFSALHVLPSPDPGKADRLLLKGLCSNITVLPEAFWGLQPNLSIIIGLVPCLCSSYHYLKLSRLFYWFTYLFYSCSLRMWDLWEWGILFISLPRTQNNA